MTLVRDDDNPFVDYLEQYRQQQLPFDELPEQPAPKHRKRRRKSFGRVYPPPGLIFGALPQSWMDRINRDPKPTVALFKVAYVIVRAATLQNTLSPAVSNKHLALDRFRKARALAPLERLGLVHVEQSPGCAPIVHLILDPNPCG
jgi:hypothetical protein